MLNLSRVCFTTLLMQGVSDKNSSLLCLPGRCLHSNHAKSSSEISTSLQAKASHIVCLGLTASCDDLKPHVEIYLTSAKSCPSHSLHACTVWRLCPILRCSQILSQNLYQAFVVTFFCINIMFNTCMKASHTYIALRYSNLPSVSGFLRCKCISDMADFLCLGADIVLGMLPLAREMLRMGTEVVLCANHLPAINDITATELEELIETVAEICPTLKVNKSSCHTVQHLIELSCSSWNHACWFQSSGQKTTCITSIIIEPCLVPNTTVWCCRSTAVLPLVLNCISFG